MLSDLIEAEAIAANDGVISLGDWEKCAERFRLEVPKGQMF